MLLSAIVRLPDEGRHPILKRRNTIVSVLVKEFSKILRIRKLLFDYKVFVDVMDFSQFVEIKCKFSAHPCIILHVDIRVLLR